MALRVVRSSRFTLGEHLDQLISSCDTSIFALRTLKSHGLRLPHLHLVARVTIVASLLYTTPAWLGLPTAEKKFWMERLLGRLRRGGYLPADFPSVESLAVAASQQLFVSIIASNKHHVHHDKEDSGYNIPYLNIFLLKTIITLSPNAFTQNLKHRT